MSAKLSALALLLATAAPHDIAKAQSQAQSDPSSLAVPTPPSTAQVMFTFDRPGVVVPHYTIEVGEDQRGTYAAEIVSSRGGDASVPVTAELQLTSRTTRMIFSTVRTLLMTGQPGGHAPTACGMTQKNLADTGRKTLRYLGPEGEGACTYNQFDKKEVVALTNLFQGIAETLDAGRRLDFDHRFDRLALDAEMSTLVDEIAQGQAAEPGVIARTLRSIARDPEVIERVRLKASGLLQQASAAD